MIKMVYYRLDPETWEELTQDEFIAIPVYGGTVWRKPGYKNILVDHENPEITHITDSELDELVSLLDASLSSFNGGTRT